jgi:hypothetical protein
VAVVAAFGAGFGASLVANGTVQTIGIALALSAFTAVWLRFFYSFVYAVASPRAARSTTVAAGFGMLGLAYSSSLDDRVVLYGAMAFALLMFAGTFIQLIAGALSSWRR